MDNRLTYNGVITLAHRIGDRIVSRKFHNNGTTHLFEAFARALCGQSVTTFLPRYIDIGDSTSSEGFTSHLKTGVTIPVMTTYKALNTDGGEYGTPYCRVSAVLLPNMFENLEKITNPTVQLKTIGSVSDDIPPKVLAQASVADLVSTIKDASTSTQTILLWDLYLGNNDVGGDN